MCKSTGNLAQARNRATSWHLIQEIYKTTFKKTKQNKTNKKTNTAQCLHSLVVTAIIVRKMLTSDSTFNKVFSHNGCLDF